MSASRSGSRRLWTVTTLAVAGYAASLFVGGCADRQVGAAGADCIPANLDLTAPDSTARDWVTYADHLAIVHVTAETPGAKDVDVGDPATGIQARSVTVQVNQVLWSRATAPRLPTTMTWSAAGWTYDANGREKTYWWGYPRLEVGHTYVSPITYWRYDTPEDDTWAEFTPRGVLPYDDGVLGQGETTPCANPQWAPVAEKMIGERADALADVLRQTKPDQRAVPYMDLNQSERYQRAVQAD